MPTISRSLSRPSPRGAAAILLTLAACAGAPSVSLTSAASATADADLTQNTVGELTAMVNPALCLDVGDLSTQSGAWVQIYACGGASNQVWTLSNDMVQVYGSLCLTPTGTDNGSAVVVNTCDGSDPMQKWKLRGAMLVNVASRRCLDVRNGGVVNGTRVQIYDCYRGNSNQTWLMPNQKNVNTSATDGNSTASTGPSSAQSGNAVAGTSSGSATPVASSGVSSVDSAVTGPVTFSDWNISGGFTAISLNDLLAQHPQLAGDAQLFVAAAAQASPVLPPQLLVAICLQESSGGLDDGSYGGPFQFTDDGAWAQFGPKNGDRNAMGDAAIGAANYMAYLLQQNGNDLNAALRSYNGPISQGGLASYQSDIQAWMQGTLVYGSGV